MVICFATLVMVDFIDAALHVTKEGEDPLLPQHYEASEILNVGLLRYTESFPENPFSDLRDSQIWLQLNLEKVLRIILIQL